MGSRHIPVMVEEVMTFLKCEPGHTYVDATLGGGGHASEILKRSGPDGMLIGMEWDEEALSEARKTLLSFGDRVKLFRENFVHLPDLMKPESADGILLDLGLSSIQLEKGERGFSFRGEGPLDMRMDQRMDGSAADLVNNLSLGRTGIHPLAIWRGKMGQADCKSHRTGKRTRTHQDYRGFKKDCPPCHPKTVPIPEN